MNIHRIFLFIVSGLFILAGALAESATYIIPSKIENTRRVDLSLNGNWQFKYSEKSKWTTIEVPGEAVMQGYAIEHDKPFWYKKTVTIPAEFAGKRIILRFDGVYSYARLTVNGTYIRDHHGGFTRWETDITDFVKPGKNNEIILEVTDRLDEISYASGYAHHPIGGILRDITLFVIPETHLYDFRIETHLDTLYTDAVLQLSYFTKTKNNAEIEYTLIAPDGQKVSLEKNRFTIAENQKEEAINRIHVTNPLKWDAEHPYLYTLNVSWKENGREIYCFNKKIGFRDVKTEKDRLLVNGHPVKLRGACRHDIHPTLGRTTTAELDSLDAVLFKKANMNFVRTSHYPPSETFLEYCDKMGIYVECETAVCFVDTYRQKNYAPGNSQDDPAFTDRYLSQYKEMVKSFYSHPSILFWSIGNESVYGENFQQSWDWSKSYDKTRPVIFSYPGSVKGENQIYDILSMHYQDVYGNLSQWGMTTRGFQGHGLPALFDEWAHPACYTYATLQEDPNIREFWGKSLDMMWDGLFAARGGLGGAIWGYIDETFMVPPLKAGVPFWKEFAKTAKPESYQGDCVGYGEWGIVDVWRREKPEFWATRKAYSPFKILQEKLNEFIPGQKLILPIHNRFDHTNLNEIKIIYTYQGVDKSLPPLSLEPHEKGILIIPAEMWENGETLTISSFTKENECIDRSTIQLGQALIHLPAGQHTGNLRIEETPDKVIVTGNDFKIPFIKATGLIKEAVSRGNILIEEGPFLNMDINLNHLTGAEIRKSADKFIVTESDWQKKEFNWQKKNGKAEVQLSGSYKDVTIEMTILIHENGKMDITYLTNGQPNGYVRETGLKFYLPTTFDYLTWKRAGYWSYYPKGHFAGNEEETGFYSDQQAPYGKKPGQAWTMDTKNYYYWADSGSNVKTPLTNKAKGMKENIYYYTLSSTSNSGLNLSVISEDASTACRTNKRADGQLILHVNNQWDYPEIAWGNYCKTVEAIPTYGTISILF